jgi:hypothetical protein
MAVSVPRRRREGGRAGAGRGGMRGTSPPPVSLRVARLHTSTGVGLGISSQVATAVRS